MASIISDKPTFRNADGGPTVLDKIFGYMDESVNIYNKAKAGYITEEVPYPDPRIGLFGMPSPWGGVVLVAALGIVAFGIYKIAK